MGKAMSLQLTGVFKPCKACALDTARKIKVSKMSVSYLMVKGEGLFIDINSPSTASLGGKKYWLLIVENNTDYALSYFLPEKSELKDVMM